jgi:hypothetical protein
MSIDTNSPWPDLIPGLPASSATWPSSVTNVALICPRCGANHRLEQCPQVKAIEYHEDGRTIRRVEFLDGTGARLLDMTVTVGAAVRLPEGLLSGVSQSFWPDGLIEEEE